MAANPMGPTFDGGEEVVGVDSGGQRYEILFLPDVMNDDLQREGKPPCYYWVPRSTRIARRGEGGQGGESGDYKFRLIHFVGVQTGDTHVGVSGTRETAGGVLAVTSTAAPPLAALESAKQALIQRVRGTTRRFWALRSNLTPQFAPTPVSASRVAITNLSPSADGTLPIEMPVQPQGGGGSPPPGGGISAPTGGTDAGGGAGAPPGAGTPRIDGTGLVRVGRGDMVTPPRTLRMNDEMRYERDVGGSALDPWHWGLQGTGAGPIDPAAEHAFSGLLGTLPTAILWQGFKGAFSPVSVVQSFLIPVWSTNIRLRITGSWRRVFEHFSSHAKGRYHWFSADIKAEFNNLRISGGITVDLLIDGTAPAADQMQNEINRRIDLVVTQFTALAQQIIFAPAPQVAAAEAGDGGGLLGGLFGFGGGLALKWRRDQADVDLRYEETRKFRYNRFHVVSSSLEGFYDEIKKDPNAERKYFETLYLDDWDRKVTRFVKPVVNWPDPAQHWVGDPVAFLSAQIGYPDTRGAVQWAPRVFQSTDTGDTTRWAPAFAKKAANEVVNAPAGWTPDKTFVKRRVHFTEPPGALQSPNNRVFVERNIIELDQGENGTLSNDNVIEVRADSVGVLEVGPISLNVALEDRTQVVEVEFQCRGRSLDGVDRPVIRFSFNVNDQDEPRRWKIFTGDPAFVPDYRYRVRVIVRGSIFSNGMEWTGPWMDGAGNGPLMVSVPRQDDPAVNRRALVEEGESAGALLMPQPPATGTIGPPPSTYSESESTQGTAAGYELVERKLRSDTMTPVGPPPAPRTTRKADRAEVGSRGVSSGRIEEVGGWRR